jgi:hypothetical protein
VGACPFDKPVAVRLLLVRVHLNDREVADSLKDMLS